MAFSLFDQATFDQNVEAIRPNVESVSGQINFIPGGRRLEINFPSIAYRWKLEIRRDHIWIHGPQRPTFQSVYASLEYPMDLGGASANSAPIRLWDEVSLDLNLLCDQGRIRKTETGFEPIGPLEQ